MAKGKDMAMVIAWPECWAKAPESFFQKLKRLGFFKSTYFQIGHAGIALINGADGRIDYFDFGRYSTGADRGRVRSRRSDPKLDIDTQAEFDAEGELNNLEEILWAIKSRQDHMHGEGSMHLSVCKQFDYQAGKQAAEDLQNAGSLDYGSVISGKVNCANFVQKVLLRGVRCAKTRRRLRFPLTLFRSTPLGNVETVRTPQNYIVTEREIITKKRLRQPEVLQAVFRATVINVTRRDLDVQPLNCLEAPKRHPSIPPEAQWLGGQGEGTWLILMPLAGRPDRFRITGRSSHGDTEYDFIAAASSESIDPDKPYRFIVDCSRLGATLIQDQRQIKLSHYSDY